MKPMTREEALDTLYRFIHLAIEEHYSVEEMPEAYGHARDALLTLEVIPDELSYYYENYPHA